VVTYLPCPTSNNRDLRQVMTQYQKREDCLDELSKFHAAQGRIIGRNAEVRVNMVLGRHEK
jgi:hypothetical protein